MKYVLLSITEGYMEEYCIALAHVTVPKLVRNLRQYHAYVDGFTII